MEVLKMESVALKLATQYSVQKPALAALICTILGETHLVTNGFAKAIVLDERGLELYEGNGDIRGQMITLHRLGSCHKSLGNYKQAIVRFKNVRKIYVNYTASPIRKPLGEDFMEVVLASLGKCCTNVGQNHKAIETHQRCRKLAEARKDSGRLAVAKSCENLGQAYSETGQFNTALDLFQQANVIAKEENCHGLPDEQAQIRNIGHVGIMQFALGRYRVAILQFELAMQQAVSIGSKQDQGFYCTNLGCCYSKAGDHAKAIALQEQSLQIFNALKERTGLGQVHSHLATCLEASGEYGLAIKAHLEARTVAKEVGNRAGESVILGALGGCHKHLETIRKQLHATRSNSASQRS
jgi:tetratricopeptide (TPR) repeat protein